MKAIQKMHSKRQFFQSSYLWFIILCIIILITRLWHISVMYGPWLMDDEMGYWSHAANLAGLSWKETFSYWYSYGYSVVIAPLFFLTHNMRWLYRGAIVINAFGGVVQFWLSGRIIADFNPKSNWKEKYALAFAATCFSAYVFQSYIGWSETLTYILTLVTIHAVFQYIKKPVVYNLVLSFFSCWLLYVTHNRNIVVFIAYAVVVIWMSLNSKVKWWHVICMLVLVLLGFAIHGAIRRVLEGMVWVTKEVSFQKNDVSTVGSDFLNRLSSSQGLLSLVKSSLNKLWALFAETLLLGFFGFVYIIRRFITAIKERMDNKYFWGFIILLCLGLIAVTAISMNPTIVPEETSVRVDPFIYSRYMDSICGILIICGFFELTGSVSSMLKNKDQRIVFDKRLVIETILGIGLFLYSAVILINQIGDLPGKWYNTCCIPGLYFLKNINVFAITVIAIAAVIVFVIIVSILGNKGLFLLVGSSVLIFGTVAQTAMEEGLIPMQEMLKVKEGGLYECLQVINSFDSECPVYLWRNAKEHSPLYVKMNQIRANISNSNVSFQPLDSNNLFIVVPKQSLGDIMTRYPQCRYVDCGLKEFDVCALANGRKLVDNLEKAGFHCYSVDKKLDVGDYFINADKNIECEMGDRIGLDIFLEGTSNQCLIDVKDINLSYHIFDCNNNSILEGDRVPIVGDVTQNTYHFDLDTTGLQAGEYTIVFDLVEEGVAWYSALGGATAQTSLSIRMPVLYESAYEVSADDFETSNGWSTVHGSGCRWMNQEEAEVRVPLLNDDYFLVLELGEKIPFDKISLDRMKVRVLVNDIFLDEFTLNSDSDVTAVTLQIPKTIVSGEKLTEIRFETDRLWEPAEFGLEDPSHYAFSLKGIKLVGEEFTLSAEDSSFEKGWTDVNASGFRWINSNVAEIGCYLADEDYEATFHLGNIVPFDQISRDLEMKVYLNDEYIDTISYSADHYIDAIDTILLSKEAVDLGRNVIRLELDDLWSPSEYGSEDTSEYGISIDYIEFHRVS